MALYDHLEGQVDPELLADLRVVQREISDRFQTDREYESYFEVGFPDYESAILSSPSTPPGGVYGVGLWDWEEEIRPTAFVLDFGAPSAGGPVYDTPARQLLSRLGIELPDYWVAVGLPLPEMQNHGPGSETVCLGLDGFLGAQVTTDDGTPAITTAGHVGYQKGALVSYQGQDIGEVTETDRLANHIPGETCADMAVVELLVSGSDTGGVSYQGQSDLQIRGDIEAHAKNAPRGGWIRGLSEEFALDRKGGSWGDVGITDSSISVGGDSGAPCLNELDEIVGHIVAGATSYSVVQGLGFQLDQMNLQLR